VTERHPAHKSLHHLSPQFLFWKSEGRGKRLTWFTWKTVLKTKVAYQGELLHKFHESISTILSNPADTQIHTMINDKYLVISPAKLVIKTKFYILE